MQQLNSDMQLWMSNISTGKQEPLDFVYVTMNVLYKTWTSIMKSRNEMGKKVMFWSI